MFTILFTVYLISLGGLVFCISMDPKALEDAIKQMSEESGLSFHLVKNVLIIMFLIPILNTKLLIELIIDNIKR